jgi:hypothetical protein
MERLTIFITAISLITLLSLFYILTARSSNTRPPHSGRAVIRTLHLSRFSRACDDKI